MRCLESLFAAGIRQAAGIENEAAAIAGLVLGQALVKRKTENPHRQIFGFGAARPCSFSEASMLLNASISVGSAMGSFTLCSSQRRFFSA